MVIAPLLWSIAGVVTRNLSPELQAQGRFEITFWRSVFAAVFRRRLSGRWFDATSPAR